jgi:hypothetical protein
VLLLNECLFLLFISLSTQYGNFWIHPRMSECFSKNHESKFGKISEQLSTDKTSGSLLTVHIFHACFKISSETFNIIVYCYWLVSKFM